MKFCNNFNKFPKNNEIFKKCQKNIFKNFIWKTKFRKFPFLGNFLLKEKFFKSNEILNNFIKVVRFKKSHKSNIILKSFIKIMKFEKVS